MTVYRMMTCSGNYGPDIEAYSDEEAAAEAEKMGYEVRDIMEHGDELVIIVA